MIALFDFSYFWMDVMDDVWFNRRSTTAIGLVQACASTSTWI